MSGFFFNRGSSLVFLGLLLLAGCTHAPSKIFYCPMYCEQAKTYPQMGECPVCGMDLEIKGDEDRLHSRELRLVTQSNPPSPKKGNSVQWTFKISHRVSRAPVTEFEDLNGVKGYLWLMSQGHQGFVEIPVSLEEGQFKASHTFDKGGNFQLFLSVRPKGELLQTFPISVLVEGKPETPVSEKESLTWKSGKYGVRLEVMPYGRARRFFFTFERDGKPLTDLQPIHGKMASAVAVAWDYRHYSRLHVDSEPSVSGSQLTFHGLLPGDRMYRVWLQFRHGGLTHVAGFVVPPQKGGP